MPFNVREEVLNIVLADLLSQRGMLSIPESILASLTTRGHRLPDVLIADLQGVRTVLEGRIGSNAAVKTSLLNTARSRVEEGISPICLAVLYPPETREVESLARLKIKLSRTPFLVRVVTENSDGDWAETNIDGLTDMLRRSYELLVNEDVVTTAVDDLSTAIDSASEAIASTHATPARLRMLLGIPEETEQDKSQEED